MTATSYVIADSQEDVSREIKGQPLPSTNDAEQNGPHWRPEPLTYEQNGDSNDQEAP